MNPSPAAPLVQGNQSASNGEAETPASQSTHRQILRSSTIIGGATVFNIVIGLLRAKVAAVLLGPAGLGLIGLLQSLMSTASTVSSLGFGNVGTRQIAEANGRRDTNEIAAARRALFLGTMILAAAGAGVFWSLRRVLAVRVLGEEELANVVGWLALGVMVSVAAGSQSALLRGMRRVGDMARVSVWSALISTALGITALYAWGQSALVAFVLATPVATFVLGHVYVARLPRAPAVRVRIPQLIRQWSTLVRLGFAFMIAGISITVGQLAVRTVLQRELGLEALGHFQAAWAISMTYISVVLAAMGTDYYPRLSASIHDPEYANRIVNEQTEVALLLAGPILLAVLGLAPWIIDIMYSSRFAEAVDVLRWQILGDILKVASWPLGFVIMAIGDGRTFVLTESFAMVIFVGLTWFGVPIIGLNATGIAFVMMYVVYLPTVYLLARRKTGFRWSAEVTRQLIILIAAALFIELLALWSDVAGIVAGLIGVTVIGYYALYRLASVTAATGKIGWIAGVSRKVLQRLS